MKVKKTENSKTVVRTADSQVRLALMRSILSIETLVLKSQANNTGGRIVILEVDDGPYAPHLERGTYTLHGNAQVIRYRSVPGRRDGIDLNPMTLKELLDRSSVPHLSDIYCNMRQYLE